MASHLGLRSLTMSHLWDARLKWVNTCKTVFHLIVCTDPLHALILRKSRTECSVRVLPRLLSVCECASFPFDFVFGMWDLIVQGLDNCLSVYSGLKPSFCATLNNVAYIRR